MSAPAGTVEVPLGLFSGICQELSPTDLPAGLSPDCINMAFIPSSVFTRPSLKRFLTLPATAQIVYATTYTKPDGTTVQFVCDANGIMYADGVQIGRTVAGSRFKTAQAFGRLYIAISDGQHGTDVPLQFDGTNLDRVSQDGPAGAPSVADAAPSSPVALSSLSRTGNQVTATTASPHMLQVGYQAVVQSVPDLSLAISSIAINNNTDENVATFTFGSAHGFVPGNQVAVVNVTPTVVGGGVTAWNSTQSNTSGNITIQFTTSTAHGLRVGDQIIESTNGRAPRQHAVDTVLDSKNFTVQSTGAVESGTTATLVGAWPLDSGQVVTIVTVPSPTTFTIALNGPSLTWNTGNVTFPWDGNFYVTSVQSPTMFTYTQNGPVATATNSGTVTPLGQIAPGTRSVVCFFQTRTGYQTAPSPQVQYTASGGQYALVTNIPIGPANVVARIMAFTGANGGQFFYLPVAPQTNGVVVGTSTVVNDNTTTSAVFDFTDQSLLSATAIDIPGNNLFRQAVLGPVLGFHSYASRLFAWGEWNKIEQFVNMGFEGGVYTASSSQPLGWTLAAGGTLSASPDYGLGWTFLVGGAGGALSQTAFRDRYGVQILQPQTQYTFRAWALGAVTADLYSPSVGVLATATITGNGSFGSTVFSAKTPVVIPSDTILRVYGNVGTMIDELEVVYTANQYLKTARASYFNNPEAFDGVSGIIGPANDPNEIRAMFERKDVLHILTYGPNGALYDTYNNAQEPSDWDVRHVASSCGAISVWGDAKFEDWQVWASDTGLRMYDGGNVEKMSQEIQPTWDTITPSAKQFSFVANDPYTRRIYVGLPLRGAVTVNAMYPLDYRELNTAASLEAGGPYKIGQGGKVFTSDITRKWCPWTMTMNYCTLLQVAGTAVMVFCAGTGTTLSTPAVASCLYNLAEGVVDGTDDDYGSFASRYTTYFFVSQDEAPQIGLKTHRKLFTFLSAYISGVGQAQWTPLVDLITNPWPASGIATLKPNPNRDLEFNFNTQGDRCAFRLDSLGPGGFNLNNVVVAMKDNPHSPIGGSNG